MLEQKQLWMLCLLHRMHSEDDVRWAPPPPGEFRPRLESELDQLLSTPPSMVADLIQQLGQALTAIRGYPSQARSVLQRVLTAGEPDVLRRMVSEIEQFWKHCLAPHWPSLSSRAEEDVDLRGRISTRQGLTAMLNGLHPSLSCEGNVIGIGNRDGSLRMPGRVTLFPTALTHSCLSGVSAVADPTDLVIAYPVRDRRAPERAVPGSLSDMLGPSRIKLLSSLGAPHTTSQLAALHHLSASTVSYHLALLLRAGLVTRSRSGSSVYYRRSGEAAGLCGRHT